MEHVRRWTAWASRVVIAAMVVGLMAFALPASPVAAATTVVVTPHGMYAKFAVKAEQPKKFILSASTAPPTINYETGEFTSFANVASAVFGGPVSAWNVNLPNLKPDTTYHYILKVTDPDQTRGNPVSYERGTFKTKKPTVTVHFHRIEMIDDGDGWPAGAGDFWFYFGINGTLDGNSYGKVSVDSGQTIYPSRKFTTTTVPSNGKLKLSVRGVEDDCGVFEFCSEGLPSLTISPDNDYNDGHPYSWATRHLETFVMFDDQDPDHKKDREFTIEVKSADLFHFKVHGSHRTVYE